MTIQLPRLESAQTIVFTFLVIAGCINTPSQIETVLIYTSIPIWIVFDHLNESFLSWTDGQIKCFMDCKLKLSSRKKDYVNLPDNCTQNWHNLCSHQGKWARKDNLNIAWAIHTDSMVQFWSTRRYNPWSRKVCHGGYHNFGRVKVLPEIYDHVFRNLRIRNYGFNYVTINFEKKSLRPKIATACICRHLITSLTYFSWPKIIPACYYFNSLVKINPTKQVIYHCNIDHFLLSSC